jgi:sortase (surface protein transpeptidase)
MRAIELETARDLPRRPDQSGGRWPTMRMPRTPHVTRAARTSLLLLALALVLSLLVPVVAAAQEAGSDEPIDVLAEVPSTGGRRPGPVTVAASTVTAPATETAVATPAPPPTPLPAGVAPVELRIDSVGVDAPIELGAVTDGAMQDPSGPWVVSWYDALGTLGQGGNVVLAGHVDYYNAGQDGTPGPAVFWNVRDLPAGELIRVVGEDGQSYAYAVQWTQAYAAAELTPDVIQHEIVGDTGQETLTLITCGGDFDPATGEYLQRWVVRATQL